MKVPKLYSSSERIVSLVRVLVPQLQQCTAQGLSAAVMAFHLSGSVGGVVRRTGELRPVEAIIGCGFATFAKRVNVEPSRSIFMQGGGGCHLAPLHIQALEVVPSLTKVLGTAADQVRVLSGLPTRAQPGHLLDLCR